MNRLAVGLGLCVLVFFVVVTVQNGVPLQPASAQVNTSSRQLTASTTVTPPYIAPTPTNTFVGRATPDVKATIRLPRYTLGTRLPTITPSGVALDYLPKAVNALKKRLPASFGILNQSTTSIASANVETFGNQILIELEGPTKAIYVVEMQFLSASDTAYTIFMNAQNTMKNSKSAAVGENALIAPSNQDKIALMRYRNVLIVVYANNSPTFGDITATTIPLTETQLVEILQTIEKALKAELALQGQSK